MRIHFWNLQIKHDLDKILSHSKFCHTHTDCRLLIEKTILKGFEALESGILHKMVGLLGQWHPLNEIPNMASLNCCFSLD